MQIFTLTYLCFWKEYMIRKVSRGQSQLPWMSLYCKKEHNLSLKKSSLYKQFICIFFFFSAMTLRIVFRISVLVLLIYSAVTQKCPAGGRSESSIVGWMLRGHVYDTLLAELPFTCVFKCREDNRCQSFNWVISRLMCEFNNRTKEARPEDFIPNPDRFYYRRDLERGEPARIK